MKQLKKDLEALVSKWNLGLRVRGSDVSLSEAREAVRMKLQALANETRPLASPPRTWEVMSSAGSRMTALGLGTAACIGAGSAAWSFMTGSTPFRTFLGNGRIAYLWQRFLLRCVHFPRNSFKFYELLAVPSLAYGTPENVPAFDYAARRSYKVLS